MPPPNGLPPAGLATRNHLPARPASINGRPAKPEDASQVAMRFLIEQNKHVEPLYQLEKDGKLSGEGEKGLEGKAFLEGQLLQAGPMLGDLWYSAWQKAPPDTFLKGQLVERKRTPAAEKQ